MPSLDDVLTQATNDTFEVDFSEAISFDPIPDGDYVAVVESVEPGLSKANEPKLTWKFVLTEGENAKRVLFQHTPTGGKGSGRIRQILRALGVPSDGQKVSFKLTQVVGKSILLSVGRQKDNDDFNDVKRYKAYEAPSPLG